MRALFTGVLTAVTTLLVVQMGSRWRFRWGRRAFRCQVRLLGEEIAVGWPRLRHAWSRLLLARWDGDALVVRRGLLAGPAVLIGRVDDEGVRAISNWDAARCGHSPLSMQLYVNDGACVEIAVPEKFRFRLVGPYVTAALRGLPSAPVPRREND